MTDRPWCTWKEYKCLDKPDANTCQYGGRNQQPCPFYHPEPRQLTFDDNGAN
jgi:hypothetical protein